MGLFYVGFFDGYENVDTPLPDGLLSPLDLNSLPPSLCLRPTDTRLGH